MPRPAHDRLQFRGLFGTVAAPLEEWSFSVNGQPGLRDGADDLTDWADLSARAESAYNLWIKPVVGPIVRLTEIRALRVAENGRTPTTPSGSFVQHVRGVDIPGTFGGTQAHVPQVAIAVSLRTARGGPTGKGRFYLPASGYQTDATLRLSEANANSIRDAAKGFLNALQATGNGEFIPVVASTKGYLSPVTSVAVGRAFDTIRSRRGDMPEGYVSAAL